MNWMLLVVLLADYPQPHVTWNISYVPQIALLKANGESYFCHDSDLYVYDQDGNLIHNATLSIKPELAFIGPDDTIFIHDGVDLLAALNPSHNLKWQKSIAPPTTTPIPLDEAVVYAVRNRIMILDPATGQARYSLHHHKDVASILVREGWVLISDATGETLAWEPVTAREQIRFRDAAAKLRFVNQAHTGELALTYGNGSIKVLQATKKVKWQRKFHIEISVPPVWVEARDKAQLVVATQGRNVLAYGQRGEEIARHLIDTRPLALLPLSRRFVLLLPESLPEILWYDSKKRTFTREMLEHGHTLFAQRGHFVLLLDYSGIIRLYKQADLYAEE